MVLLLVVKEVLPLVAKAALLAAKEVLADRDKWDHQPRDKSMVDVMTKMDT